MVSWIDYRSCGVLLDSYQIWCIVIALFMRPIASQPRVSNNREGGAGGYRAFLALLVIGAILIGLLVIGLAGAMAINISSNFSNIIGQDPAGPDPGPEDLGYYQKSLNGFI